MLKFAIISILIINKYHCAECTGYRNWTNAGKSNYERGRTSYKSIIDNIKNNETECQVLIKDGKFDTNSVVNTTYPCIEYIDRTLNKFDIDIDPTAILKKDDYVQVGIQGGCWKYVLRELESLDIDKCDLKGDVSRSLIALAKTKCHFLRANRPFPTSNDGCILNPRNITTKQLKLFSNKFTTNPCSIDYNSSDCELLKEEILSNCTNNAIMSESAFQLYHADLNHIDDICFYLQSSEWNKRTELNINKLSSSTGEILKTHQVMEYQLNQLQLQQQDQLNKAVDLTEWIDNIRNDMNDILSLIVVIRDTQKKLFEFINNFKTSCLYAIFIILGLCLTSFEFARKNRPKILFILLFSCFAEALIYKFCMQWPVLNGYNYDPLLAHYYAIKTLRIIIFGYIIKTIIFSYLSYKPMVQVMLNEMYELKNALRSPILCISNHTMGGYTLDEFVENCLSDDSPYEYESESETTDSDDYSVGEDSEDLVDEYITSRKRRHYYRHNGDRRRFY